MSRILMVATLFVVLPLALLAACSDEESEGPPIQLQQADRDQITQLATSYVTALAARDMAAAKSLVLKGVPEATITKSMDTVRDEGFKLVKVGDVTAVSEGAEVLVHLTDKDGKEVTRKLEFRQEGGGWVVYSPHLKPL